MSYDNRSCLDFWGKWIDRNPNDWWSRNW